MRLGSAQDAARNSIPPEDCFAPRSVVRVANIWFAALLFSSIAAAAGVSIQYADGAFRVTGRSFGPTDASGLASAFIVSTQQGKDATPIFGSYSVENRDLVFRPRYPLTPGATYYATFGEVSAVIHGPQPSQAAAARIIRMYPSSPVLPSNQLKLYILFSAPMKSEDFWPAIHLTDSNGTPAYLPFVGQELWNKDYTRLTLIFDPGRIKRGVKPNVDLGPVLVEGKHYILTIDRGFKDANGQPLAEPFRHEFAVGPAERRGIDPKLWKLSEPKAGTADPLVITFDRPLDYALLSDSFQIPGISGTNTLGLGETEWRFQPSQPWTAGEHTLVIDMALEDLAGNRIGRPFDVDTMTSPADKISASTTALLFRVPKAP